MPTSYADYKQMALSAQAFCCLRFPLSPLNRRKTIQNSCFLSWLAAYKEEKIFVKQLPGKDMKRNA